MFNKKIYYKIGEFLMQNKWLGLNLNSEEQFNYFVVPVDGVSEVDFLAFHLFHEDGGIEGIEHIPGVICHHSGIVGDPVRGRDGVLYPVGHTGEDTAEPVTGRLVGVCVVRIDELLIGIGILTAFPLGAQAAEHQTHNVLAIMGSIAPGQHGTPAVSKNKVR